MKTIIVLLNNQVPLRPRSQILQVTKLCEFQKICLQNMIELVILDSKTIPFYPKKDPRKSGGRLDGRLLAFL